MSQHDPTQPSRKATLAGLAAAGVVTFAVGLVILGAAAVDRIGFLGGCTAVAITLVGAAVFLLAGAIAGSDR